VAAKTLVKREFLGWLKGKCSISDPSSTVTYEEIIKRIEDGDFDNSKDRNTKVRTDCEFLRRVVSHVPYEENESEEWGEFIIFHQCIICDRDLPCVYPARHCNFKVEFDAFAEYIMEVAKNSNEID